MKALSTSVFKARYGLSVADLNRLKSSGEVKIQQNGFVGDSLHHHKLAIFPDGFTMGPPKFLRQVDPPAIPRERPPIDYWGWCPRERARCMFQSDVCQGCGWNRSIIRRRIRRGQI